MTTWLKKFKDRRAERREINQEQKCWAELGRLLAGCRNLGQALGKEYAEWALDRAPSAQAFSDGRKNTGVLSPQEIVGAVLADALAAELPELFDIAPGAEYKRALHCIVDSTSPQPSYRANEVRTPLPAKEIMHALIIDRFIDRAAKILSGDLEPVLDRPALIKPPAPKTVELVTLENVALIVPYDDALNHGGKRKNMKAGDFLSFRLDYADKLINTGKFLVRSTPEGEKFIADRLEKFSRVQLSSVPYGPQEYFDLGDPLNLLQAEREEVTRAVG
jgi:hypothetical protein